MFISIMSLVFLLNIMSLIDLVTVMSKFILRCQWWPCWQCSRWWCLWWPWWLWYPRCPWWLRTWLDECDILVGLHERGEGDRTAGGQLDEPGAGRNMQHGLQHPPLVLCDSVTVISMMALMTGCLWHPWCPWWPLMTHVRGVPAGPVIT